MKKTLESFSSTQNVTVFRWVKRFFFVSVCKARRRRNWKKMSYDDNGDERENDERNCRLNPKGTKKRKKIYRTLFGGALDAHSPVPRRCEECAQFPTGDDVPNGTVGHSVANDHRDAFLKSPTGRTDLRVHSAETDTRLFAVLNGDGVFRAVRVDETGSFLGRRTGVNTVHVRHQNQEVGIDFTGQSGCKTVVVLDTDDTCKILVDHRWRWDGIVRVDDGHDIEADEFRDGRCQMAPSLFIVEIGFRHKDLSNLDAVLRKHGVVEAHQSRLTHSCCRSWLNHHIFAIVATVGLLLLSSSSSFKS